MSDKLDLILTQLEALAGRIGRSEADAQAALESVNALAKSLKPKNLATAGPDHSAGIGLDQILKIIGETEERTTRRIGEIISLVNSNNQNNQKTFMDGLSLGRELSAIDDDGDGVPDYLQIITQLREALGKKAKPNGIYPPELPNPGRQAGSNGADHDGENL